MRQRSDRFTGMALDKEGLATTYPLESKRLDLVIGIALAGTAEPTVFVPITPGVLGGGPKNQFLINRLEVYFAWHPAVAKLTKAAFKFAEKNNILLQGATATGFYVGGKDGLNPWIQFPQPIALGHGVLGADPGMGAPV